MIEPRVVRGGLGALSGLGICLGLLVVRSWAAAGTSALPATTQPRGQAASRSVDTASGPALAALVAHDPFRARRAPSPVTYDPEAFAAGSPAPRPPKPSLMLTGIAWGAEPEAVIEGLPGTDGPRVLHQGDAVARLRVKTIGRNRVVIVGMDTTWVLEVREPWR